MKITTIDRSICRMLRSEIEAAVKEVAAKHGLTVTMNGGRFNPNSYSPKIELTTTTAGGIPATFASDARMLGLEKATFGMPFTCGGKSYTLEGFAMRRRRFPCIGRSASGKQMLFTVDTVQRAIR